MSWDPFKESTEKFSRFMSVLDNHMTTLVIGSLILIGMLISTYWYRLSVLSNTMPCSKLNVKLDKLSMPSYYELKPIPEERIKPSTTPAKGQF